MANKDESGVHRVSGSDAKTLIHAVDELTAYNDRAEARAHAPWRPSLPLAFTVMFFVGWLWSTYFGAR